MDGYDYSSAGVYFVTVCTKERQNFFWEKNVGPANSWPEKLSPLGCFTLQSIQSIPSHYKTVVVENCVIMPNHIHLLLRFDEIPDGQLIAGPTLSQVVSSLKRIVSKHAGFPLWQHSFHDHIVRNEQDFAEIYRYIEENPLKWDLDRYFLRTESAV